MKTKRLAHHLEEESDLNDNDFKLKYFITVTCECGHIHVSAYTWRARDNPVEMILSFHLYVGFRVIV